MNAENVLQVKEDRVCGKKCEVLEARCGQLEKDNAALLAEVERLKLQVTNLNCGVGCFFRCMRKVTNLLSEFMYSTSLGGHFLTDFWNIYFIVTSIVFSGRLKKIPIATKCSVLSYQFFNVWILFYSASAPRLVNKCCGMCYPTLSVGWCI